MTKTTFKRIAGAVVLAGFLALPAAATDYYVDALHGNDNWNGECMVYDANTCGPREHIQAGLDLATTPGDVVNVLPGEYLEGFTWTSTQNGVTLKGLGEAVITSGPRSTLTGVTGARIENLIWRGPATSPAVAITECVDLQVHRCQFRDGGVQLAFCATPSSGALLRENAFFDNAMGLGSGGHAALSFYQPVDQVMVDRCTFVGNSRAIGSKEDVDVSGVDIRNCVFHNNTQSVGGEGFSPSYCCYYQTGGSIPDPLGTNIVADPLFIDSDNRVFYVKAGSPLLNQGQDGGPIGAFGQGFHSSRDVSKDEPAQGVTPWAQWIDANGDDFSTSTLVELTDDFEVILKDGVTEAAIYSPVFDTQSQFTIIRSVDFAAFEDLSPDAGSRQIIDADQATPLREIRIRTSLSSFSQWPIVGVQFEPVDKLVKFEKRAQFAQLELVLRSNGD